MASRKQRHSQPQAPNTRLFQEPGDLLIDHEWLNTEWASSMFGHEEDCPEKPYMQMGSVAVIQIDGPLSQRGGFWWDGYESIRHRFEMACADSSVESVILRVNSPGGVVSGCFENARAMLDAKVKSKKSVYAVADSIACSAAYAIACVADRITVPATGTVGSVGVITTAFSLAGALKKEGVEAEVITSGEQKGDLHPLAPLGKGALKRAQARIDTLAAEFFAWVAERRGMSVDDVRDMQAAAPLGREAVAMRLADSIGTLDSLVAKVGSESESKVSAILDKAGIERFPIGGFASFQTIDTQNVTTTNVSVDNVDAELAVRTDAAQDIHSEHAMNPEELAKLLGLSKDASATQCAVEITGMKAALADIASLTGKKSFGEAHGVMLAWKASHERVGEMEAAEKKRQEEADKAEHKALLDKAVADGKVPPASREAFSALPTATLRAFVQNAPRMVKSETVQADTKIQSDDSPENITASADAVAKVAAQMNLTPTQVGEHVAKQPHLRIAR